MPEMPRDSLMPRSSFYDPRIILIMIIIGFIVGIFIIYFPIMFKLKEKGIKITRQLGYLGLICSFFIVLIATILFIPIINTFTNLTFNLGSNLNLIPFGWLREPDVINQIINEVLPNVIMLIPLGFFLPIVFKKMRKIYNTAIIVFLTTVSVELIQYFVGRSTDIDDIILNILGGIIGYGIFIVFNRLFKDKNWWNTFIGN